MPSNRKNEKGSIYKATGYIPYLVKFLDKLQSGYLVLMYHSVSDEHKDYRYNLRVDRFEKQMQYLSENFEIVSTEKLVEKIKNNAEPEGISLAVTFDDGYMNNYQNAVPILEKKTIPTTFFITTGFIENKDMDEMRDGERIEKMTWDEIKDISSRKVFTVGSHTHTHPFLPELTGKEMTEELEKSKKILEEKTDEKIKYVSYPGGRYNKNVIKTARKSGYDASFTSDRVLNNAETDLYKIGRVAIINNSVVSI